MSRALKLIKGICLLPYKAGLYTVLLGVGIVLGAFGPQIVQLCGDAYGCMALWNDATYDPDVLTNPEKELDLIRSVESAVDPKIRRAEILIRKQQAEIGFLSEQCRLIENNVPAADGESAADCLRKLNESCADDASPSGKNKEAFRRLQGPTWLALQEKIAAAEDSLRELIRLKGRVQDLRGRLEKRRLITLRYVPEEADETPDESERSFWTPELGESNDILRTVHETLYKTVYTLDPKLVSDLGKEDSTTAVPTSFTTVSR